MSPREHDLDSANRSLVLVRKIVADLRGAMSELRQRRRELLRGRVRRPDLHHEEREREVERLRERVRALERELEAVGARLLDAEVGRVAFPLRGPQGPLELLWQPPADRIESWRSPGGPPRPLEELPPRIGGSGAA